jgi:hypothetical protein
MLRSFLRSREIDRFQSRSAERDAQTDIRMLSAVAKAIDDALAVLEVEKDGLSERFNEARDTSSAAAGAEYSHYLWREPEPFAQVQGSEEHMIRAAQRIKQLSEQIADLRFVRTTFHFRLGSLTSTGNATTETARTLR